MKDFTQWEGFNGKRWKEKIDVRNFIRMNYTPYDGDASFLEGPTEATDKLWGKLQELQKEERAKGGVGYGNRGCYFSYRIWPGIYR